MSITNTQPEDDVSSLFNVVVNTPMRHLGSQSSLHTISSGGSLRSRSHRSTNSNRASLRSRTTQKRTFRPLSTLEEQRHEAKPSIKLSRNSKPFEPEIEFAAGQADIENASSSSDTPMNEAEFASEEEQDETVYPGPVGLALLSLGLMLSVFLIALDRTIITPVRRPGTISRTC